MEAHHLDSLIAWTTENQLDLCVAGEGLANRCQEAGIPCWRPPFTAAQLEAYKELTKEFMHRHAISADASSVCADVEEARASIPGEIPDRFEV